MATVIFYSTLGLVLIAAGEDLSSRKIPNFLTAPAAGLGLLLHTLAGGWGGVGWSLLGLLVGLGCLMVFYRLGGLGAGDVKLLGAVGALVGPQQVYHAFLATALLGGALALGWTLVRGTLREHLRNLVYLLPVDAPPRRGAFTIHNPKLEKMPYGAVIAAGTLVSFWI